MCMRRPNLRASGPDPTSLLPKLDADLPSLLFRTDDAIDLSLGDHVADFAIADAVVIETQVPADRDAPLGRQNLIPESWPVYFAGKCRSEFSMALERNARHFPKQRIDPIGTMKGKFDVYQS
jgi:hypothetical protein